MISDGGIRKALNNGELFISPLPDDFQFQPASVDLRLDGEVLEPLTGIRHEFYHTPIKIPPGKQLLGSTIETVYIPDNMIARVEGKSTWGRKFITIHSTAGFIDPGFEGGITLEIMNQGPAPVELEYGALICQISFDWLDEPALRPYGHPELRSKYQHQQGPTAARC